MNAIRLNFSYNDQEFHKQTITNLREVATETRRICAIILDTKGPEIRTGKLKPRSSPVNSAVPSPVSSPAPVTDASAAVNSASSSTINFVQLYKGQDYLLTTDESILGDNQRCAICYSNLPKLVKPGNHILIESSTDDSTSSTAAASASSSSSIDMLVMESNPSVGEIKVKLLTDGMLYASKNVTIPGVIIHLPAITQKDVTDITWGLQQNVDFIAVSYVRKASDIQTVRKIFRK